MALNSGRDPATAKYAFWNAEKAWGFLMQQAFDQRVYLTNQRAKMTQPTVSSTTCIEIIQHFWSVIPIVNAALTVPGLDGYAKAQQNSQAFDTLAEVTAWRNQMQSTLDSLVALFPTNANGFALFITLGPTGFVYRDFTAAQVAPALPFIDAVMAAT